MAATELLRLDEAAGRLGTSQRAVYDAVHKGRLPAFHFPCPVCKGPPRVFVPADALDAYAAKRRTRVPPDVAARIRTLAASGLGAKPIARLLNGEGARAPGGGRWTDTTIRKLLRRASEPQAAGGDGGARP